MLGMGKVEFGQFISRAFSGLRRMDSGSHRIYGNRGDYFDELSARLPSSKVYEIGFDRDQQRPFAKELKDI